MAASHALVDTAPPLTLVTPPESTAEVPKKSLLRLALIGLGPVGALLIIALLVEFSHHLG